MKKAIEQIKMTPQLVPKERPTNGKLKGWTELEDKDSLMEEEQDVRADELEDKNEEIESDVEINHIKGVLDRIE